MKKVIAAIMVLAMALSMAACGATETPSSSAAGTSSVTTSSGVGSSSATA